MRWPGTWFRRQLDRLQLTPVCQVTYQRFARVGSNNAGSLRLTIDRGLCCAGCRLAGAGRAVGVAPATGGRTNR